MEGTQQAERNFSIRTYRASDHACVRQLFTEGMLEYLEFMPDSRRRTFEPLLNDYVKDSLADDLSRIEEVYMSRQEHPKGNFWVVVEETSDGREVVQGMVGLEYKSPEESELRRMSVAKDARRMKLGWRLLNCLIEFARNQGFKRVVLSTGQHMPQANTMYVGYGFKRVKEDLIAVTYEYLL